MHAYDILIFMQSIYLLLSDSENNIITLAPPRVMLYFSMQVVSSITKHMLMGKHFLLELPAITGNILYTFIPMIHEYVRIKADLYIFGRMNVYI